MTSHIAKRANEIWTNRGKPKGKYSQSWHEAEAELRKSHVLSTDAAATTAGG
jgi:hypothetical protein